MAKYTSRNLGEDRSTLSARAKWGIGLLVFSLFFLFCLITSFISPVRNVVLGIFGMAAYPVFMVSGFIGILLLMRKRYYVAKVYVMTIITLFLTLVCLLQLILSDFSMSFGEYMSYCYTSKTTAGGLLMGIFAYGIITALTIWGAVILLAIITLVCVAFIIDHFLKMSEYKQISARTMSYPAESNPPAEEESKKTEPAKSKSIERAKPKIGLEGYMQQKNASKSTNPLLQRGSPQEEDVAVKIFGEEFINSVKSTSKDKKPAPQPPKSYSLNELFEKSKEKDADNFITRDPDSKRPTRFVHEEEGATQTRFDLSNHNSFNTFKEQADATIANVNSKQKANPLEPEVRVEPNMSGVFDSDIDLSKSDLSDIIAPKEDLRMSKRKVEQVRMPETSKQAKRAKKSAPYLRPPIELLTTESAISKLNEDECQEKVIALEDKLESLKIPAKVMGITRGPAITRYELQMPSEIPVKRIAAHSDDIAMAMESKGKVRIEAPIPGKSLVGIEIPNDQVAMVGLRDLIESDTFINSKAPLTFALGKDIAGESKICDLQAMPHLLVAGSTGSGKSVCLNVILISLLYKLSPDDLKFILIDPKRVEFVTYNNLPHMLVPKAITEPQQALNALDWAIKEMSRRYSLFGNKNVRSFKEYNSLPEVYRGDDPKLPYIVIVVDELADLMMIAGRELEDKIKRLTQLARAAGIHLIIATQRPSVDVITGIIKSNLPSRIAFSVTDFASSKTILDQGGADKLRGHGDMLYSPQNLSEPIRIQCPYVDGTEVHNIVEYIKEHNSAEFDDSISEFFVNGDKNRPGASGDISGSEGGDFDPLLPRALLDFIETGQASASFIQRRHSVGFTRAGRILDQMERAGYVSPSEGNNKIRNVLITQDEWERIFGENE